MSLDGFAWVGLGLWGRRGDEYAIGGTSQQTTRIKLTAQPYRDEIGTLRPVQLRGFRHPADSIDRGLPTRHCATTPGYRRTGPPCRQGSLRNLRLRQCDEFTLKLQYLESIRAPLACLIGKVIR